MSKKQQLARQDGRCVYCETPIEIDSDCVDRLATWDEIVPQSAGGLKARGNRVLACYPCNHRKGSRDVAAFSASLRRPIAPPVIAGPLYHGTMRGAFSRFAPAPANSLAPAGTYYFTDDYATAESYAKESLYTDRDRVVDHRILTVRLTLRDPKLIDAGGRTWHNVNGGNVEGRIPNPAFTGDRFTGARGDNGEAMFMPDPRGPVPMLSIHQVTRFAQLAGHDGLIVRNVIDAGAEGESCQRAQTTWIAFDPDAIEILETEILPCVSGQLLSI